MKTRPRSKTSIRQRLEGVIEDMVSPFGLPRAEIPDVQNVIQGIGSNDRYWAKLTKKYAPKPIGPAVGKSKKKNA